MTVATLPATPAVGSATDDLGALRARLAGRLITAESPDYDEARRLVDFSANRRPLAIVRAVDSSDVATAVDYARDRGLPLAVRGGGHGAAFHGVVDDALVVDISAMNAVAVDPVGRIARVQAGATSGDLAAAAHAHGLALSTGDTASVGLGGLVTGGGIGPMVRRYGLAADNLLSARVVTAAGEVVAVNAAQHPDLFWAIRGGGGNVGVVTEFAFRLAPVGQVLGGELILPASRGVLRGYLDQAAAAPDDLTLIANLMHAPPMPHVPPERVGELVLSILVCWTGDEAAGARALAPLRALATPVADTVGPIPYPKVMIPEFPPHASRPRSMFADGLSDAALDATLAAMARASSPASVVQFRGLGGAMARVPDDATAFAHRRRRYLVTIIGLWLDPAEDAAPHEAWADALWRTIRPEGSGVYVNFLGDEGPDRVREAYPPATYARLAEVKRRWDPDNLFRFNQNVPPTP